LATSFETYMLSLQVSVAERVVKCPFICIVRSQQLQFWRCAWRPPRFM